MIIPNIFRRTNEADTDLENKSLENTAQSEAVTSEVENKQEFNELS